MPRRLSLNTRGSALGLGLALQDDGGKAEAALAFPMQRLQALPLSISSRRSHRLPKLG